MVIKTSAKTKKTETPFGAAIEKLYSKSAPLLMFEALLFAIVAVIIFIKPLPILATLTIIFGVVLALFGLYQLFIGLLGGPNEMAGNKTWNIILGLLKVILGIVFLFQPAGSMIAITYAMAILLLIKSISSLVFSIRLWRAKFGNYVLDTLMSVGMIVLAVLVMFFPYFGAVTAMYFIAVTLLVYAVADVSMYTKLLKLKKTVQ